MNFLIKRGLSLKGEITVPGDKSISHRSIILSSLAEGTSTVFSVKEQNSSYEGVNHSSQNYLAICWKEIQGFSRFGEYIGNAAESGPFIYCGFKPALIMISPLADLPIFLMHAFPPIPCKLPKF